jgi:acetylornithine/N-succinyldiaminopimelate aminotransferase
VRHTITGETAAILIEPIQGEGGIRVVERGFLQGLRKIADEHGLLLILDEIQCGVGRTGKLFAHEWAGITPDIMGIAKGIGGGFPVGACLATEAASETMTAGSHGSTFGGNPLAMAVGNAVLDIVLEKGFLEAIREKGLYAKQQLAELRDSYPDIIEEVRGEGLMLGLKCRVPNGELITAMIGERVLSVPGGDNVVRLLPPLIVTSEDIREAVQRIGRAAAQLRAKSTPAAKAS